MLSFALRTVQPLHIALCPLATDADKRKMPASDCWSQICTPIVPLVAEALYAPTDLMMNACDSGTLYTAAAAVDRRMPRATHRLRIGEAI